MDLTETLLAPLAGRIVRDPVLLDFAAEVGGPEAGQVAVRGGGTRWTVGGSLADDVRIVLPPSGVVEFEPAEMTVRVRAGTTVAELQAALRPRGQTVALPDRPGEGTVGGVLAVGRSGIDRLGRGHVRETLLQARFVTADGLVVTAGGPTVKNVTGFDLPRLLVGSLGTLGFLAEVILRTRPVPQTSAWLAGTADPTALRDALYWPTSILWDGERCWVALEGHAADVEDQANVARRHGLEPVDGPPSVPPHRRSCTAREVRNLGLAPGTFLAEIGVGVLHTGEPSAPAVPTAPVVHLHRRIKDLFDPSGRLNPGRDPLLL